MKTILENPSLKIKLAALVMMVTGVASFSNQNVKAASVIEDHGYSTVACHQGSHKEGSSLSWMCVDDYSYNQSYNQNYNYNFNYNLEQPSVKASSYKGVSSTFTYDELALWGNKAVNSPASYISQGMHEGGMDIGTHLGRASQENLELVAPFSGKVVYAGFDGAWGNRVILQTPDGRNLALNHLANISVRAGQYVSDGQHLGQVGETGHSFGIHLHLGMP